MSEEKESIIVKDKYYGSPNSSCPACENAFKDVAHVGCSAIKLYVMRMSDGTRFIENPEYHCMCFRKKPELHYLIASQLNTEDVKAVMVFKPKKEEYKIVKVNPDETVDLFADRQETLG